MIENTFNRVGTGSALLNSNELTNQTGDEKVKNLPTAGTREFNWKDFVDSFPVTGDASRNSRSRITEIRIGDPDLHDFLEKTLSHCEVYKQGILPYLEKTFQSIEDKVKNGERKNRFSVFELGKTVKTDHFLAKALNAYCVGAVKKASTGKEIYGSQKLKLNIPDPKVNGLAAEDNLTITTIQELKKELITFLRRKKIIVGKTDSLEWHTIKGGE